jgi:hypothetical protein
MHFIISLKLTPFFNMLPSPDFCKQSYNDNHFVGFIFTKKPIKKGAELLWKYSVAQTHRTASVPSPRRIASVENSEWQCRCISACTAQKHCLTPQTMNAKRARVDAKKFG